VRQAGPSWTRNHDGLARWQSVGWLTGRLEPFQPADAPHREDA
jgi:hypothetical protein